MSQYSYPLNERVESFEFKDINDNRVFYEYAFYFNMQAQEDVFVTRKLTYKKMPGAEREYSAWGKISKKQYLEARNQSRYASAPFPSNP